MSQAAPVHAGRSKRTALFALHQELGAKIVPFAGYDMPVQYPAGIIAEHAHTRSQAGLFDVSHMGQVFISGQDAVAKLETLIAADLKNSAIGQVKYGFFLNETGGVLDDLLVSRLSDREIYIVVNASRKDSDLAWMKRHLHDLQIELRDDLAQLALQGPLAAAVLARFCDAPTALKFMHIGRFELRGCGATIISRSGYTGEDGFEISLPNDKVMDFAKLLLAEAEVKPIGLGARDTLRLEAGLCLYGHELDATINPVEANILWAVAKPRREAGGYLGADAVQQAMRNGVSRKRVGIRPAGRAPARDGTVVLNSDEKTIGIVTSGSYGPTVGGPVCMGYVQTAYAAPETTVLLDVRGQHLPATIVALPFAPHRYYRG